MTAIIIASPVDSAIEAGVDTALGVAAPDEVPVPDEPVLGPTDGPSECAELEAQICALAGNLAAAECRWLQLVAAYDAVEGWRGWECRSAAHWLSWKCGMGLRVDLRLAPDDGAWLKSAVDARVEARDQADRADDRE
jgi:hypothetical protein